jgi:hypothetical protein
MYSSPYLPVVINCHGFHCAGCHCAASATDAVTAVTPAAADAVAAVAPAAAAAAVASSGQLDLSPTLEHLAEVKNSRMEIARIEGIQ